ncbi:MAG: histidine kinase [Pirellulaceae bacterium]
MNAILLSGDLMFLSRVQGAARSRGVEFQSASSVEALLEHLAEDRGALVMIDLSAGKLDVAATVGRIREKSPLVRIVAYGPHVHEQKLAEAASAGCDVMTRGQFNASFDSLLAQCADDGASGG